MTEKTTSRSECARLNVVLGPRYVVGTEMHLPT